jgi:hypothetical protein
VSVPAATQTNLVPGAGFDALAACSQELSSAKCRAANGCGEGLPGMAPAFKEAAIMTIRTKPTARAPSALFISTLCC